MGARAVLVEVATKHADEKYTRIEEARA